MKSTPTIAALLALAAGAVACNPSGEQGQVAGCGGIEHPGAEVPAPTHSEPAAPEPTHDADEAEGKPHEVPEGFGGNGGGACAGGPGFLPPPGEERHNIPIPIPVPVPHGAAAGTSRATGALVAGLAVALAFSQ